MSITIYWARKLFRLYQVVMSQKILNDNVNELNQANIDKRTLDKKNLMSERNK